MEENRQRTILLVEDQALVAATERILLERHGYAVITADTGEKAVELALGTSDIDLILMDIDLGPGIDGTAAAKIILDTYDIPIVFLSGHTEQEVVEKTELITSYGYIVKNSGDTVLLASLKMAFRLRESERKFRSAFESVSVGMVLTSASGELLRANAAFAEIVGRSVAEVQAVNFTDLTHPDDIDISFRYVRAMLGGGVRRTRRVSRSATSTGTVTRCGPTSVRYCCATRWESRCISSPMCRTSPSASETRSICASSSTSCPRPVTE
ncbi:MAG: response regulator [Spirochaetes bacterium]|nr:response regulator [Spirochaetota bacterium]